MQWNVSGTFAVVRRDPKPRFSFTWTGAPIPIAYAERLIQNAPAAREPKTARIAKRLPEEYPLVALVRRGEVWVEQQIGDGKWMAAYRLAPQYGEAVIAEVRVFPNEAEEKERPPGEWSAMVLGTDARVPRGGITHRRVLRQVKLEPRRFVRKFFTEIRKKYGQDPFLPDRPVGRFGFTVAPDVREKRGAQGRPDLFYAEVAAGYVEAIKAGSRSPVADVAAHLSLAAETVRDAVHIARKRGLLSPTTKQGRMGGDLTGRARRLLETSRRKKERRRRRERAAAGDAAGKGENDG